MLFLLVIALIVITYLIWLPNALEINRHELIRSKEGVIYISLVGFSTVAAFWIQLFDTLFLPWLISLIVLALVDNKHQSVRLIDLIVSTSLVLPLVNWYTINMSAGIIILIILVLFGVKWLLKKVYGQDAFGGADIWVITLILLAFNGALSLVAIYAAIISSALVGILLMTIFKRSRRSYLPFIPFLTFGVFLTLVKGPFLLNQYIEFINN